VEINLLSAISKVMTGQGIQGDAFSRTDLCHFSSIGNKDADVWPQLGLFCESKTSRWQRIFDAAELSSDPPPQSHFPRCPKLFSYSL